MQLTKVQQGGTTVASYTYDANGNRATMVTSAGTTTYTYDSADVMLVSKKDPTNKVTNYTYDSNGNLTKAVYDPTGANQTTTYKYDANNRLIEVDEPSGTVVKFMYDADGNRISKAVTSGGTTATINDVYSLGHLAEQTDNSGNILATFTYDMKGEPTSVIVGNPTSGTRYYYVYNGHGDVVALVDTSGTVQASYSYDAFGNLTSSSETLANGWSNPYRFDGAEGVRYDPETGLYWMSVRAYDPTLGRFISHDPLGRLAALGLDTQPYVYASNNPVNHTDPTGLYVPRGPLVDGNQDTNGCLPGKFTSGCPQTTTKPIKPSCLIPEQCKTGTKGNGGKGPLIRPDVDPIANAQSIASSASKFFNNQAKLLLGMAAEFAAISVALVALSDTAFALSAADWLIPFVGEVLAPIFWAIGVALEVAAVVMMNLARLAAGLAVGASILGQMFYDESQNPRSWWTTDNVDNFGSEVHAVADGFAFGIPLLIAGFSKVMKILPGPIITGLLGGDTYLGNEMDSLGWSKQITAFITMEDDSLSPPNP